MITRSGRKILVRTVPAPLRALALLLGASAFAGLAGCGQSSPSDAGSSAGGPAGVAGGSSGNTSNAGQAAVPGGAASSAGATFGGAVTTGAAGAGGSQPAAGAGSSAVSGASNAGSGGSGSLGGTASAGDAGSGSGGSGGGPIGGPSNGTDKITIWLAGDSTMANGTTPCPVGWGKQFQAHFNANAKVVNSAVGGTTVRSWLYDVTSTLGSDGECTLGASAPQARWTEMANGMKKGDYLFIQFGINDTTSSSCPKHVSLATFKKLFGMMAQTARDKGAQPVFLTAVSSISCNGSAAQGTRGGFATATKDAAIEYGVPVIDLEQLSVALYTSLGFCPSTDSAATFSANTPIGNFFCNDHTHFETTGAAAIADVVAKALRDQNFGLASYLVP